MKMKNFILLIGAALFVQLGSAADKPKIKTKPVTKKSAVAPKADVAKPEIEQVSVFIASSDWDTDKDRMIKSEREVKEFDSVPEHVNVKISVLNLSKVYSVRIRVMPIDESGKELEPTVKLESAITTLENPVTLNELNINPGGTKQNAKYKFVAEILAPDKAKSVVSTSEIVLAYPQHTDTPE
jgi:hypothetical protein